MMKSKVTLYNPVFIVSIFRTGSTLLRNILDANSFIAVLPEEMHVWNPYPWAFDIVSLCKKQKISDEKDIKRLVDVLFSGRRLYGAFWRKIGQFELDRGDVLENAIRIYRRTGELSCMDLVNLVFLEYLFSTDKLIIGGKNPVYGTNIELLKKLYPDSKIICLVRDPRAIYLSKANDEFSRKIKAKLRWRYLIALFEFITLVRIILEYTWLLRTCKKHCTDENVILVKYEDIVTSPSNSIKRLCSFLDVPFEKEMLHVTGKPSSVNSDLPRRSIDPGSAFKWKRKIKPWQYWILTKALYKSIRWFGYEVRIHDSHNNDD